MTESHRIEYKRELTDDLEKHVVAFLNARAGTKSGPSRDQGLKPLLHAGWLEMTIPDKPTSSKQRYRTTATGRALLEQLKIEN